MLLKTFKLGVNEPWLSYECEATIYDIVTDPPDGISILKRYRTGKLQMKAKLESSTAQISVRHNDR